ncbi:phosphatase PAP2 family protein [Streptomyces sp. NPDC002573]|uniref:phosphatase PAP2 family protein n=1 Tax=Streptomyces sp. NPDC002573 TaxID=3364651 RepID=UPI00369CBC76
MTAVFAPVTAADRHVLRWLVAHRSAHWTSLAKGLMNLGLSVVFLGLALLAALLVVAVVRAARPVIAAAGAAALFSVVASLLLKHLIARPRPDSGLALVQAGGYSMPSTDAALVAGLTVAALFAVRWSSRGRRRAAAAAVVAANLVTGLALVYLGVHWTTDVLAGWALGGATGAVVGTLKPRGAPRPVQHVTS